MFTLDSAAMNRRKVDWSMPGNILLEIHCHTREHSPCSQISAPDLISRAVERGLHGVVLTDHHYLWGEDELLQLRDASGCPEDFILLSGQEVTTRDFDDVLVFGAAECFPYGVSLGHIRSEAPQAAIVWAHPYRGMKRPGPEKLFAPELDAIEIFNRNHRLSQNIYAYRQWLTWGFVATAGTDVHDDVIGVFPCVIEETVNTVNELCRAIKNNKCRPHTKSLRGPNRKTT